MNDSPQGTSRGRVRRGPGALVRALIPALILALIRALIRALVRPDRREAAIALHACDPGVLRIADIFPGTGGTSP